MSKITAVKIPNKSFDDEVMQAVRSAVDTMGGPGRFSNPGRKVLVKPNFCSYSTSAMVDRRIPWAVARLFRDFGCDVKIGENPVVDVPSRKMFSSPEIEQLRRASGVPVLNLREEEHVPIEVPGSRSCGWYAFARIALDSDLIVSVPAMRRHALLGVTLSLKNMYGLVAPSTRHRVHRSSLNWGLAEINQVLRPRLTVMDGISIVHDGSLYPLGYIFASDDSVAIDSLAATCMGWEPMKIDHIRCAYELGLGEIDLSKVELSGLTLEDAKKLGEKNREKVAEWPDPNEIASQLENIELIKGEPCGSCLMSLGTAMKEIGIDKLARARGLAIVIGPKAIPREGKKNVIVGRCSSAHDGEGIFVDFCPAYASDIKGAIEQALGERESFETLWEAILRTRESDLPGA